MKRLLLLVLSSAALLIGTAAQAHCDGNHGHQGASQGELGGNRQQGQ
jgi:hypothetical protein